MSAEAATSVPADATSARARLAAEVRRLENELQRAQERLVALGGEVLAGMYLVVEIGGLRALLPSARVTEIVRLVATRPLPDAPAHVLGTFVCRGTPVVAIDVAAAMGLKRELPMDAHILVLAGSPPLGLIVDRVDQTVEGPRLYEGDAASGVPEGWRGSRLLSGLCLVDGHVVPLLDASPLAAGVPERVP
jgi:purine-binding chemotaxis protein CheW